MTTDIARWRRNQQGRRPSGGQHGQINVGRHSQINVGEFERQISMIGGTVLAGYGLLRGSLTGLALAAIGGALIWRGHTGHCEVYHLLGHSSACQECHRRPAFNSPDTHGEAAQARYFEQ